MSDFMQPQITESMTWIEVDGSQGQYYYPLDELTVEQAKEYYPGTVHNVTKRKGHGTRLSAPGYLDCTEWAVFQTEEEAKEYLEEVFDINWEE